MIVSYDINKVYLPINIKNVRFIIISSIKIKEDKYKYGLYSYKSCDDMHNYINNYLFILILFQGSSNTSSTFRDLCRSSSHQVLYFNPLRHSLPHRKKRNRRVCHKF